MKQVHEIYGSTDKVLGKIWWDEDEEKLASDNEDLLEEIKDLHHNGVTHHDGPKFLSNIGRMLNTGYMYAKKVEE